MWKKYKQLLKERGMSQRELARRTGIHPNTLSNIKQGRISFANMIKVADALEISLDEFREEKQHGSITNRHT